MSARPIVARRRSFINFIRLPAFFRTSVWSRRRWPMFAFAATWLASCMAGRNVAAMLEALSSEIGGRQVVVGGVSCLGQCDRPPAVAINDQVYRGKTFDELRQLVQLAARGERLPPQTADSRPLGWKIDPYENQPRYECVRRIRRGLEGRSRCRFAAASGPASAIRF